jgi:general secretion pathway protein N
MIQALNQALSMRGQGHRTRANGVAAWSVAVVVALTMWVLQLPARWASVALDQLTQGRVLLLEARGTLWHGSAFLALSAGPASGPTNAWQQRIQWQLIPSDLNEVTLSLATAEGQTHTPWVWHLRWAPSGWQIQADSVDWRFPSQWLTGLGSPWNTIEPIGQVHLASPGWQWQQTERSWQSRGQFTLTLFDFATQLSSLKPLGDYQVVIDATPHVHVDLKTLQGPLQLAGHGIWHDGKLQFDGEAWALQAQDEPVLSNLLGVLGTRNGSRAILKVG